MTKIIKKDSVKKNDGGSRTHVGHILHSEGGGVLNKKVLDANEKAKAIIEEAMKEADEVKAEAQALLAKVHGEMEKAKKDGYAKGREEGLASVTEQVASLEVIREKFYTNAEPEIIKLVLIIAEKVIGKMVRENQETIKSIVHQALDSSIGDRITVKLNPEDFKIVTSAEFEFRDAFDKTKRISFKEDESVKKGGCVVETEVGTIDARLETQLKAIKKALEL